jgi:uncharacterized protein (DUF433 family)
MATVQKSLRIPEDLLRAIEDLTEASDQDFSTVANELLAESIKMRRCPGIVFADGPAGRRARLAGTGLEVWELIATYRSVDRKPDRLKQAYPWLSDTQLQAALGYAAAYPKEINRAIAKNDRWRKERLLRQHPSLVVNHS